MRRAWALVVMLSSRETHACDDPVLSRVAQELAENRSRGGATPSESQLAAMLRASGDAHVWPRAFVIEGIDREKLLAWDRAWRRVGQRRCGIGVAKSAAAIVGLDVVADLEAPLPARARLGAWISVEARVPSVSGARVWAQSGAGAPHALISTFDHERVRARARVESGMTLQIVADFPQGPRPVLEWRVAVEDGDDVAQSAPQDTAPGERATGADPASTLFAMVNALRAELGLAGLKRDPELDVLALEHSRRMMAQGSVSHDAGDGSPSSRVQREAGENVARAPSAREAHRAFWQSPSHRANLLRGSWNTLGVAAILSPDGSIWVTELFAR